MTHKLLTTGELAKVLGVSPASVRTWRLEGVITPEFVTRGGHYRWIEQDVREQLRQAREREREQQDKD